MSIFIPDRAITLPNDVAVPQALSSSVYNQQKRDAIFSMGKRFDGTLVDRVTNIRNQCAINGTRYGIVNGALTQFAVDQAPVEDKGLRGCPAFAQYTLYSEDPGAAAWVLTQASLVLANTYRGSNIFKLKEDTSTGQHHIKQSCFSTGLPDSSVIGLNLIAKAVERDIIAIQGCKKNGAYLPAFKVNLSTGEIIATGGFSIYSVIPLSDGYYSIFLAFNVGAGGNAPSFFLLLNDAGGNGSYTGDGTSGILLGQVTHTAYGVNGIPFIPPYVPNNTGSSVSVVSEAGTSSTGTSFDLDAPTLARLKTALRGPNGQGSLKFDWTPQFDSSWLNNSTTVSLLTADNSSYKGIYLLKSSIGEVSIRANDSGNNNPFLVMGVLPGTTYKIRLDWGLLSGVPKMRLMVNSSSAMTASSGSFGSQDLRFFHGNTIHAGWIKKDSFKIYDRPGG